MDAGPGADAAPAGAAVRARGGPWGGPRGADVAGGPGPPRGSGRGHVTFEPAALRRAEQAGGTVLCVHLKGGGGQQHLGSERVTFLPQEAHALWRPEGVGGDERHLLCSQCWARLLNKKQTTFGHGLCSACGGKFPDTMLRRDPTGLNVVCVLCAGKTLVREDGRGGPEIPLEAQPRQDRAQALMKHLSRRVPLRPTPAAKTVPRGGGKMKATVHGVDGEVSLPGAGWADGGCDGEEGAIERRLLPGERFQVPRETGSWAAPMPSGAPANRNEVEWAPDPTLRALRKESESLLALLADMDYAAFEDIRSRVWQSGKLWGQLKSELDIAHVNLNASIKNWKPKDGQSQRPANLLDLSEVARSPVPREMGRARADSARALYGHRGSGSVGGEEYPEVDTTKVGGLAGYASADPRDAGIPGSSYAQSPTCGEETASEDEDHLPCELENIYEDEKRDFVPMADKSRLEELQKAEPQSIVRGATGWITSQRESQMRKFSEDHSVSLESSNPKTYDKFGPATAEEPEVRRAVGATMGIGGVSSDITQRLQQWAAAGPKLRLKSLGEVESPPEHGPTKQEEREPVQQPVQERGVVALQAQLPTEKMLQAAERRGAVAVDMGYNDSEGFDGPPAKAVSGSPPNGNTSKEEGPTLSSSTPSKAERENARGSHPAMPPPVGDLPVMTAPRNGFEVVKTPGSSRSGGTEPPTATSKHPVQAQIPPLEDTSRGTARREICVSPAPSKIGPDQGEKGGESHAPAGMPVEDDSDEERPEPFNLEERDPFTALVEVVEGHERYLKKAGKGTETQPASSECSADTEEGSVVPRARDPGIKVKGRAAGSVKALVTEAENVIQGVVTASGTIKRSIGGRVVDWETLLGDISRGHIVLELKHMFSTDVVIELRLFDEHTTPARMRLSHSTSQEGPFHAPVLSGPLAGDLPVVQNSMPVLLSGQFQREVSVDLGRGLELRRYVRIDFHGSVSPVCVKFHIRALRLRGRQSHNRPPRPTDRTARGLAPSF